MSGSPSSDTNWRLDWPVSAGIRAASACLKTVPDDFYVDEILDGFPEYAVPSGITGEGEHLCLRLEKTGDNTEFVAGELAAIAHCRRFDVSFCGLKDRHAVTRQWFSLYRPGMMQDDRALIDQISARWPVISAHRSIRKLRRGDHQGNRFKLRLRQVNTGHEDVERALERLKGQGVPNYFGRQRFGFGGSNLDRAIHIDPSTLNRPGKGRGRSKSGGGRGARKNVLYFSAARSWLFNEVLAARVADGSWTRVLPGEPGKAPTGPLWGDGGTAASDEAGELERHIVAQTPELAALFQATRMQPERRPLVAMPEGLKWFWQDNSVLELEFVLAPGQYATTILGDIFELEDMSLS